MSDRVVNSGPGGLDVACMQMYDVDKVMISHVVSLGMDNSYTAHCVKAEYYSRGPRVISHGTLHAGPLDFMLHSTQARPTSYGTPRVRKSRLRD